MNRSDFPSVLSSIENKYSMDGTSYGITFSQKSSPRKTEALNTLYSKRVQNFESLVDQLKLSQKRHGKMKLYIQTLQQQLEESMNIALAELGQRHNTLISKLGSLCDEAQDTILFNKKEKERTLTEAEQVIDSYIDKISESICICTRKVADESKGSFVQDYQKVMDDAENVLKHWAPELSFPDTVSKVPPPNFEYRIESGNLDTARNLVDDERENVKDKYIEELMTAYSELEDLYKKERARNTQQRSSLSLVQISEIHNEERYSKSEEWYQKVRVYLPEPKPAYSKYYNIKIRTETTVKDMAKALKLHMKVSNSANWQVMIRESTEAKEHMLTSQEKVHTYLKQDVEDWPRLYLRFK